MGIVSWIQNRIGGGRTESRGLAAGNSPVAAVVAAGKERRSLQVAPEVQKQQQHLAGDNQLWPPPPPAHHRLFCIGTLGNDDDELPEFTVEEVRKLQDMLARILQRARSKESSEAAGAGSGLPLDRFLNCPSSLEVDRRAQRDQGGGGGGDISPDTNMILTKARDLLSDSSTSTSTTKSSSKIKNKTFKLMLKSFQKRFMLKKMFVFHGGFVPGPSLKDPVESTMEKFIRTVLHNKISARPSNYFFEDDSMARGHRRRGRRRRRGQAAEEEKQHKGEGSCRWDRTDSEYIVLEI